MPKVHPARADSPTSLTQSLQKTHPIQTPRETSLNMERSHQEYQHNSPRNWNWEATETQGNACSSPANKGTPHEEELASPHKRKALLQICLLGYPIPDSAFSLSGQYMRFLWAEVWVSSPRRSDCSRSQVSDRITQPWCRDTGESRGHRHLQGHPRECSLQMEDYGLQTIKSEDHNDYGLADSQLP